MDTKYLKYNHKIMRLGTSQPAVLDHNITVGTYRGYQAGDVIPKGTSLAAIIAKEFESVAPTFTLTVVPNSATMGSCTGSGSYESGTSVTIKAIANSGYHFVKWQDNNTSATRSVTVTANATYTATFEADAPTTYTITVTNDGNGTASASATTATAGTTITLTATPNSGYQFKEWQSSDVTVSSNSFTMPSSNVTVKAVFEVIPTVTHTVTATAGTNGSVAPTTATVADGSTTSFTATPNTGYRVKDWTFNGTSQGVTTTSFTTPAITADSTVTVEFEAIPVTTHTITIICGSNGWTVPSSGAQTVNDGDSLEVTAASNQGYMVDKMKIDGVEIAITSPYTFTNVTEDHTYEVTFTESTSKKAYLNAYVAGARSTPATSLLPPTTSNLTTGDATVLTNGDITDWITNGKSVEFGDGTRKYFVPVLLTPAEIGTPVSIKQNGVESITAWTVGATITIDGVTYNECYMNSYINSGFATFVFTY